MAENYVTDGLESLFLQKKCDLLIYRHTDLLTFLQVDRRSDSQGSFAHKLIECPKIYRKYVLHLLKYRFAVYLSRYTVQICGTFWDTQVRHIASDYQYLQTFYNQYQNFPF